MERIFIIGAGRVGTGLALALGRDVIGIYNRGALNRDRAARMLDIPIYDGSLSALEALREATVVLLTVSDDAIALVAAELENANLAVDTIIAHTSGCAASPWSPLVSRK